MRTPSIRKHCSGQARVTLNGKDFLLGKYGSREAKQKYHRLLAEWEASGRSASFRCDPAAITIVEIVVAYLDFAKKYYGEGGNSELLRILPAMRAIESLYGDEPAISFGPLQFKALRVHLMKPIRKKTKDGRILERPRSRTYVNRLMKHVRRLFKWAASESMISGSIYADLASVEPLKRGRTTAKENEPILPVGANVVDETIKHLSPIVAAMVRFQQLTGCRPGEVCSIKPGMVDRSNDVWEIKLSQHKTAYRGKARIIYVGPQAQKTLAPYLLRSEDSNCFSPKESEEKRRAQMSEERTTPLSCGNRPGSNKKRKPGKQPGECYTTQSYSRAIRNACAKAFPPGCELDRDALLEWNRKHAWSPNQLRHSMATNVRNSHGIEAAQVLLGHSEIAVTQVYAEADKEKAIQVVRKIG